MFKIVKREEMADGTVILNEIEAPQIAAKAKPGQFVILKANETGERIPLTMADTDPDKGTVTIIYQVVGKSTTLFKEVLQTSMLLPLTFMAQLPQMAWRQERRKVKLPSCSALMLCRASSTVVSGVTGTVKSCK